MVSGWIIPARTQFGNGYTISIPASTMDAERIVDTVKNPPRTLPIAIPSHNTHAQLVVQQHQAQLLILLNTNEVTPVAASSYILLYFFASTLRKLPYISHE